MRHIISCIVLLVLFCPKGYSQNKSLRIGIVGLTHTHVHGIFASSLTNEEFEIVGIVEPNKDLANRYASQYHFPMDIVYETLEEMIAAKQPTAVTAFGNIYDHLKVVEACAPAGIHVMVEKPLAVSLEHAKQMQKLADRYRNPSANQLRDDLVSY